MFISDLYFLLHIFLLKIYSVMKHSFSLLTRVLRWLIDINLYLHNVLVKLQEPRMVWLNYILSCIFFPSTTTDAHKLHVLIIVKKNNLCQSPTWLSLELFKDLNGIHFIKENDKCIHMTTIYCSSKRILIWVLTQTSILFLMIQIRASSRSRLVVNSDAIIGGKSHHIPV